MKSLYESILDDEEDLITAAQDNGLNGFGDLVNKITGELNSRFDKMRKDSKLKNLIFPDHEEVCKDVRSKIEYVIKQGKDISKSFSSHTIAYTIKRKDRKTADELNHTAPRDSKHPNWIVDFSDEIKQAAQYFDKNFNTRDSYNNPIKIKCDIGNIVLRISLDEKWETNTQSEAIFRICWSFEYRPSTASKNKMVNTNPKDFLGHLISDGDLAVGVQRGYSHFNLGAIKLAKSRNFAYIGSQRYELKDIIVIQHNGKSIDMGDI